MAIDENFKLYKYRQFSDTSLRILSENTIWYAKPGTFNDPFDTNFRPKKTLPAEYHAFLRALGVSALNLNGTALEQYVSGAFLSSGEIKPERLQEMEKAEEGANEFIANLGVLSLSTKNDNLLMWAHYADKHSGFCIEFSDLHLNPKGKTARKVSYNTVHPVFNSIDVITRKISEEELLLTKSAHWEYEDEYRLICLNGNSAQPLPGTITAIIFGVRMEEAHKKAIADLLSGRDDIKFKQATKVTDRFELAIVDA